MLYSYENIQPHLLSVLKLAAEINHNQVKMMFVLCRFLFQCFLWFESNYEDLESWRCSGWNGYLEHSSPTCLKQGWQWIQTWELFPVTPWKPPGMENLSGQLIPIILYPQRRKKFSSYPVRCFPVIYDCCLLLPCHASRQRTWLCVLGKLMGIGIL